MKVTEVRSVFPAGIVAPENEKPKTVLPDALTVNPASAAEPPVALDRVIPDKSN